MPRKHHVTELIPHILKKDRQLTHHLRINRTVYYLLKQIALTNVHRRRLYSLQVVLKRLQHRIINLLQIFVILLVKHFRNRIGQN